jgi:hypothetical protein
MQISERFALYVGVAELHYAGYCGNERVKETGTQYVWFSAGRNVRVHRMLEPSKPAGRETKRWPNRYSFMTRAPCPGWRDLHEHPPTAC